jgi:hypothetical protein
MQAIPDFERLNEIYVNENQRTSLKKSDSFLVTVMDNQWFIVPSSRGFLLRDIQ